MEDYRANLNGGQDIYIPAWSCKVQYENLIQACKFLGQANVIAISDLDLPATIIAITGAEDHKTVTQLVLHFVQQVRIDGEKIDLEKIDVLGMGLIAELFCHVVHSQFSDFFESGLAKVASQNS